MPKECELDGDTSEDPIATSLICRLNQGGGLGNSISEAEVKKQKLPVFVAPKHVVKGNATTVDWVEGHNSPGKSVQPKSKTVPQKIPGLKPPTQVGKGPGSVKPSPRPATAS